MIRSLNFYRGLLVGAGLMYVLDPQQGRTRRALLRDKGARGARSTRQYLGKAGRDLRNRARGAAAQTAARIRHDHLDDKALVERVRAKLGRYVSHPHAIEVKAEEGRVVLRGPILREETERLIAAVSTVRGVSEVVNQLEQHDRAEGIPALQGGMRNDDRAVRRGPAGWGPGVQLLAGFAGAAAIAIAAREIASRLCEDGDERASDLEAEMPEYAMLR